MDQAPPVARAPSSHYDGAPAASTQPDEGRVRAPSDGGGRGAPPMVRQKTLPWVLKTDSERQRAAATEAAPADDVVEPHATVLAEHGPSPGGGRRRMLSRTSEPILDHVSTDSEASGTESRLRALHSSPPFVRRRGSLQPEPPLSPGTVDDDSDTSAAAPPLLAGRTESMPDLPTGPGAGAGRRGLRGGSLRYVNASDAAVAGGAASSPPHSPAGARRPSVAAHETSSDESVGRTSRPFADVAASFSPEYGANEASTSSRPPALRLPAAQAPPSLPSSPRQLQAHPALNRYQQRDAKYCYGAEQLERLRLRLVMLSIALLILCILELVGLIGIMVAAGTDEASVFFFCILTILAVIAGVVGIVCHTIALVVLFMVAVVCALIAHTILFIAILARSSAQHPDYFPFAILQLVVELAIVPTSVVYRHALIRWRKVTLEPEPLQATDATPGNREQVFSRDAVAGGQ